MEKKTYRAPLALAIVALVAASLVPVSGAQSQAHTFTFGPGHPEWTVIELDVMEDHSEIHFTPEAFQLGCPMVLSFSLVRGTPEESTTRVGLMFTYLNGATGIQADGAGLEVPFTTVGDPSMNCGQSLINWIFSEIPADHYYLVAYHAGRPVTGSIPMSFAGNIQILGTTTGASSFFLEAEDFEGVAHARASPPAAGAGQAQGGVEIGAFRAASHDFEGRPWFVFGTTSAGASQANVLDPLGVERHMFTPPVGTVSAGGVDVAAFGVAYGTTGFNGNPAGEYQFNVDLNAEVGAPVLSPGRWSAFGADIVLPGDA